MNLLPQIVDEKFENKWVENLTNEQYHAMSGFVSSSGVREALKSPRSFYRKFVMGERESPSKAMQLGSIVHLAILEPDKFRFRFKMQPDFGNMRTNVAKEKRDAWLKDQPQDAVILDEGDYGRVMKMIDSVLGYNSGMIPRMLAGSIYEKSGLFRDKETGLACRIRPDILKSDLSLMPDFKTSRSADKDYFSRAIWNYGYATQLQFYAHGIEQIHGKRPDQSCFIVVESQEPFDTCIFEMDEAMKSRGDIEVRHGLNLISRCLKDGQWPGYQPNGAEIISFPVWTDGKEIAE